MATVTKRGDSYRIKVSCGYDVNGKQVVQTKTWKPEPDMTARQIKKELERQCVMFEEECKKGQVVATIKFETFAEQWFEEYAKINLRNTSFERMKQLTARVYPAIGICGSTRLQAGTFSSLSTTLSTAQANAQADLLRERPSFII